MHIQGKLESDCACPRKGSERRKKTSLHLRMILGTKTAYNNKNNNNNKISKGEGEESDFLNLENIILGKISLMKRQILYYSTYRGT